MKEIEKKKAPNSKQRKSSGKPLKQDHGAQDKNNSRTLKPKDNDEVSSANGDSITLASGPNTGTEPSEGYENAVMHYMDDIHRSNEESLHTEIPKMVDKDVKEKVNGFSSDVENEHKEEVDEYSDPNTNNDSISSQGDSVAGDDEILERPPRAAKTMEKCDSSDGSSHSAGDRSKSNGIQKKQSRSTPIKPTKASDTNISESLKNMEFQSELGSEPPEVDGKSLKEPKNDDIVDQDSQVDSTTATDEETVNHHLENGESEDKEALSQKIADMESRIEKLEEELREVAALEIALYSVVPEHGSSAHKLHTPSRRLCRLYIHACKYWSSSKRATVAKNTVSGLVLIAKSCGNDVPRLTFWLSNTVVLREIIGQAFGISYQQSSPAKILEGNRGEVKETRFSSLQGKKTSGRVQPKKQGFLQVLDDWEETRTFTAALERVESWIFSRIVESIWWQTLTPNMQFLSDNSGANKLAGRILGPSLGDQHQGSFSINLWMNAFQDAFRRLCPVRGEGHECGCLPVLARKVMEQCLGRLDVAMFNAILRESVHEIPTDPVSDPIVEPKVLPIPAGDLSFGSGAQLKNCVGNWSRWLNNVLRTSSNDHEKDDENIDDADGSKAGDEMNCFILLSSLSDLLMLPKDMLMDRSVRMEVCPQISVSLVKRILCNFTPDEFCPDSVPGSVLEALNAECIIEHRVSGEPARSFPYSAAPVVYTMPALADVAEKIAEVGNQSQLCKSASSIQRKGYTSDEDLVELDSPLEAIVDKSPSSPTYLANGNTKHGHDHAGKVGFSSRYELLREVWSA